MKESKKEWVSPELIVLVRSKPEEAVLVSCKFPGLNLSVNSHNFGCQDICPDCNAQAAS